MFKIFKRNKNKFYRVIKAFDAHIGEDVEINEVWNSSAVSNMVVNGYVFEENDIEEIDRKTYLREFENNLSHRLTRAYEEKRREINKNKRKYHYSLIYKTILYQFYMFLMSTTCPIITN